MTSFFDKCYKTASSRRNLLVKVRYLMDDDVTKSIYQSVVLPAFTYCGQHLLCLTTTQGEKLISLHRRAKRIVKSREIRSVSDANKKRACHFVKSGLDGEVIHPFKEYFALSSHEKNISCNTKIILLPKIKTEYGRKHLHFNGGKIYDMLPLEGGSLNRQDFLMILDTLANNFLTCFTQPIFLFYWTHFL